MALLDANVLHGAHIRNLLLSLAGAGFFRPRWSARILEETENAISRFTGDADDGPIQRKRIEKAFPEAMVVPDDRIQENLGLPDPDDNHVLGAAISASASVIVTENLRHFPARILSAHDIEALNADEYIANTLELDPSQTIPALKVMRIRLINPSFTVDEFIEKARQHGLRQVARIMKEHKNLL